MKRFLKDYLSFSKKERKAMVLLLALIMLCFAAPYFYPEKKTVPVISSELLRLADQQQKTNPSSADDTTGDAALSKPGPDLPVSYFVFDPNTLDEQGWKKLGLSNGLIRTILKYRMKGGYFRRPEDLSRIWGMSANEARRLQPFVRITAEKTGKAVFMKTAAGPAKKITQPIHINTAGAGEWESLPGIGNILAKRIIAFREKLGGFISVQQVGQTYGLNDSVFEQIKPLLVLDAEQGRDLLHIRLNKASAYLLSQQLYLPMTLAKAIVVYRKEYGNFTSVEDLKKIPVLPDSVFRRIAPLLSTE